MGESLQNCYPGSMPKSSSLVHWSLNHWFTDSLICCFIVSLIHGLVESLVHWFCDSLIHSFVGLLLHWSTDSLIRWILDSLVYSVSCAWILSSHGHLNNHVLNLLTRWCTSQLQHFIASASQKLSYRPLISYSHVLVSKLPPRHGPGPTGRGYISAYGGFKIIKSHSTPKNRMKSH